MKCPQCGSDNIEQSDAFDLMMIHKDECHHDFECADCGCLFQILYVPIGTRIVERESE